MENTNQQNTFYVYTDQNNNDYAPESLAYIYRIENKGRTVMINNEKYIQVNKEDVNEIVNKSGNTRIPQYKKCELATDREFRSPTIKQTHQSNFFVYKDQNNNLYIIEPLTIRIANKGPAVMINNEKYIQVTADDIKDIVEKSNYDRVPVYKNCILQEEKENTPINNPKYFTYYETVGNNKLYVNKEIFDLCESNGINLNDKKRIVIGDSKYYEIDKNELDSFMKKTGYTGQKQSAVLKDHRTLKINICRIQDKYYIPAGIYYKYNLETNKDNIYVNGVLYVNVTEEDIANTMKSYEEDGINTELKELSVNPIKKKEDNQVKKELDDMLNNQTSPLLPESIVK